MVRDTLIGYYLRTLKEMVRRGKERIEVRLSPASLSEIDKLISSGMYASRSDFVNHAVESELSERKIERNIRDKILDLIKSDPEIRDELRKV
jgi:Arc/MetJ-type ribon-helix-helix transcriptional regulator